MRLDTAVRETSFRLFPFKTSAPVATKGAVQESERITNALLLVYQYLIESLYQLTPCDYEFR